MAEFGYPQLFPEYSGAPASSFDAEVQKRLANMAQTRATGGPVAPSVAVPSAPTAPTGWGARARLLMTRAGTAAGRVLPAVALGQMGYGMARNAVDTTATATPGNFVERGLKILSGADVTGVGGWLGRLLSGGAPSVAPAGGMETSGTPPVGGWGAKPAQASVAPAPDMAFAPGAPRGMYEGTTGAPAVVAAPVGPNIVTGGLDPATSRLLSAARTTYAEAPDTGLFAKDWAPLRDQYQAGGGTWLGRTAADDANTARQAKIEAAYARIGAAKTVPGQKAAVDAFNILQAADTARQSNEATTGAARAGQQVQAQIAADKIMMSLYGPEAMKQMSDAQIQQIRAAIATQFLTKGDLAGAGAATGGRAVAPDRWGIPQNYMGDIKPGGAVPMQNTRGAVEMRTVKPAPVTEDNIKASMVGQKMTRAQAIEAYRSKGFDVSGLK